MTRHASAPACRRSMSSPPKRRAARARPQRGLTLLELLIGITVMIFILVLVLMGLRNLNAQMDRSALLRQAPQIRANLTEYGSTGALNFATLTTQQANALGAFRPETVSGTGATLTVQHEFGGQIFATGFDDDFGSVKKGKAFTLSYVGIPQAQCASISRGLALVAEGLWVGDEKTETRLTKPAAKIVKTPGVATATTVGELVSACETPGEEVTIHALMS